MGAVYMENDISEMSGSRVLDELDVCEFCQESREDVLKV